MKKIGNIAVIIKNGDIAAENVECLVVPQFKDCASYAAVGGSIAKKGMRKGLDIYDEAVSHRPFDYGSVLLTESGKNGIYLAHVATAGAEKDKQFKVIFKAILQVLTEADNLGIKTIAVPELGTGIIGNLTQTQSAKAIFAAVSQFSQLKPQNTIEEIRLVIYNKPIEPAEKVLSQKTFDFKDEIGEKAFNLTEWLEGMKSWK